MTVVATIDSREARTQWRTLLDSTGAGETDVVITRYNKPIATLINYADWLALQEELEDLRAAQRAAAIVEAYQHDPSRLKPWAEFEQELIADGLLEPNELVHAG